MADRERGVPAICRELGGVPASTLYHYLHADGTLKAPGLKLPGAAAEVAAAGAAPGEQPVTGSLTCRRGSGSNGTESSFQRVGVPWPVLL